MPIQGDTVPGNAFGVASRLALRIAATNPKAHQSCRFCKDNAQKSLLFSDKSEYVPVCQAHDQDGRNLIRKKGKGVDDIVSIRMGTPAYQESYADPILALAKATPVGNFGRRVDVQREASVLSEAPLSDEEAMQALRYLQKYSRQSDIKRIMPALDVFKKKGGAPDKVLQKLKTLQKYSVPRSPKGTIGIGPQSMLQMLASDWKTFRMTKIHSNRMNITIDGQKYTVYTRRG